MDGAETPAFDDLDITDPESVENAFREVVDLIDEAADSAPDEIEDDVKILADQFKAFFDQLEDADFDFAEIDQTGARQPRGRRGERAHRRVLRLRSRCRRDRHRHRDD